MKLAIRPLRALRDNLRNIGTAINASRHYTCASRSHGPQNDDGIHF